MDSVENIFVQNKIEKKINNGKEDKKKNTEKTYNAWVTKLNIKTPNNVIY